MGLLDLFSGKPSKDQFARLFIKAMNKAGESHEVEYNKHDFSLKLSDGARINLENMWQIYCATPKVDREAGLNRCVAGLSKTDFPKEWSEAASHVLPLVRTPDLWAFSALQMQIEGNQPKPLPNYRLGDGLSAYLGFDREDSIGFVPADELSNWGVSFDHAMEQAKDNLRRISHQPFQIVVPGVYMSPWQDSYDSSRLVLHELFYRLELKGRPIAIAPNRDVLLVTGEDDIAGFKQIQEISVKVLTDPRPLSPDVLILKDDGWADYPLDATNPEHQTLYEQQLQIRANSYDQQKSLLEALHEKTNQDIFVASYTLTRNNETGILSSLSVWTDGVMTFLPKSDKVFFYRPNDETKVLVSWEDAFRIVGDIMKPTDMIPARFLLEQFPNKEQFAELQALVK